MAIRQRVASFGFEYLLEPALILQNDLICLRPRRVGTWLQQSALQCVLLAITEDSPMWYLT